MVRPTLLIPAALLSFSLFAQDTTLIELGTTHELDTATIGGPEFESDYTDSAAEFESGILELFVPTDITDSAYQIPGYEQYRSWDTKRIFPELKQKQPADSLVVAYEACDHAHPICGKRTSGYGYRRGRFHHGVDIDLNTGDLVRSAFAGKVRISHYSRSFGNVIVVRHHNGLETLYAHLSQRMVEPGDMIEAGDFIGLGGNTGRSSGSHLHLEVRYLGKSIDPEQVFDIKEGELKVKTLYLGKKSKASASSSSASNYRIRKGDNLTRIARQHGTSVGALCRLNGMSTRTVLKIGRSLRVK